MYAAAIPGLSICLIKDGTAIWSRGFGLAAAAEPLEVNANTVFEGASLSKPLFACGVMQLTHQGVLDLDTPLTQYVPEHSFGTDPRLGRITARMVLSHTTGLPNWRRRGRRPKLKRTPGKAFGYSGEGYVYLQQVVERLSGRSLDVYMHETVLSALGMTQSSYVWRESYEREAAVGHASDGSPYPKERPASANAAMSLHTTSKDFAQFVGRVLHPETRELELDSAAMLTPQISVADTLSWGLGWGLQRLAGGQVVWHWGDNPGFKNFVAAKRKERSGVVIMTNSDNGSRAWAPIARLALEMNTEIFDWLATTFYRAGSPAL
jgi:CubicO group peptidase (beta-lactamase class C family)